MDSAARSSDDAERLETLAARLFTVGHSNLEAEGLLELLRGAGVTALADVRSSPYSRRLSQFNRAALEAFLRQHGIAYVFLGDQLGGRPASAELYHPEGWADYESVRETEAFRLGVERVVRGLERHTIALMCGEEDPLDCHRALMIAPALKELGLPPRHIRKGGRLETTAQFEQRLQEETGLGSLFPESLAEAYRVMNRKKAFRRAPDEEESGY
jgi:uncharacterized protein (DUF488 family)